MNKLKSNIIGFLLIYIAVFGLSILVKMLLTLSFLITEETIQFFMMSSAIISIVVHINSDIKINDHND